jgi:hypothetical protein
MATEGSVVLSTNTNHQPRTTNHEGVILSEGGASLPKSKDLLSVF